MVWRFWVYAIIFSALCGGRPVDGSSNAVHTPSFCDTGVQYSGYLDASSDKHLFYWFFEARQPRQPKHQTPLVLWLNGGPGCSSLSGLLSGIGPCHINADGNSTSTNPYSWTNYSNILFLDQPANTGYSFGANVTTTREAARDVITVLHKFYQKFPQYAQGELHVMGESYAAHYVPAIGVQIVRDNQQGQRQVRLASIAVGNGLFDMRLQYQYLPEMACHSTYAPIVNASTCDAMIDARSTFTRMLDTSKSQQNVANLTYAGYDILTPYQVAGGNPYDVRTLCKGGSLCDPYMDTISQFARQPWVRAALGTRSTFQLCNPSVQDAFINAGDEIVDSSQWIPEILAHNVRVLNYAGDADLICNWMGNRELMMRMPWFGQTGFKMAQDRAWTQGGVVREFGGLTVLRVEGAGHMVAKDQPKRALHMVSQWLKYSAIL